MTENGAADSAGSRLVVLGCGSSTGVPSARCILQQPKMTCPACEDAHINGDLSKNKRGNPSVIIQHQGKNILIDCGKSFRQCMLRLLTKERIEKIDAVLLTHAHADAILGLDDIREWVFSSEDSIPVYVRDTDLPEIKRVFPYLVDRSKATGSGYVAQLDFRTFSADEALTIHGVEFTPVVLPHGFNCTALGFLFGNVAYLSDVGELPDDVVEMVRDRMPGIDTVIIDATFIDWEICSHLNLVQAFQALRRLGPAKSYFTGMSHELEYYTLSSVFEDNVAADEKPLIVKSPRSGKEYELPRGMHMAMLYDTMELPIRIP